MMLFQQLLFSLAIARSCVAFAPRASFHVGTLSSFRAPSSFLPSTTAAAALFDTYDQADPSQALAVKDTIVGDGLVAENGKTVTVAYTGTLMDSGKQFDQSTQGITFRLGEGQVIKGWEQGVEGMKVGGKRVLRIPPNLAYGEKGAGAAIPPGAHIEFECELRKVASNPVEEFLATRQLEFPWITTTLLLAALAMKALPGAVN